MERRQSRRRAWSEKLKTLGRKSKSTASSPVVPRSSEAAAAEADTTSSSGGDVSGLGGRRRWPSLSRDSYSSTQSDVVVSPSRARKAALVAPWTPSLSRSFGGFRSLKKSIIASSSTTTSTAKPILSKEDVLAKTSSKGSLVDDVEDIKGSAMPDDDRRPQHNSSRRENLSFPRRSHSPREHFTKKKQNQQKGASTTSATGKQHGGSGGRSGSDLHVPRHAAKWQPLRLADPMRLSSSLDDKSETPLARSPQAASVGRGTRGRSPVWNYATLPRSRQQPQASPNASPIFRVEERQLYKLDACKTQLDMEAKSEKVTSFHAPGGQGQSRHSLDHFNEEQQHHAEEKTTTLVEPTIPMKLTESRTSLNQDQEPSFITKEKHFKVLLIGDPNVGKTSFVQRYANDSFRPDYKGTVGVDFALKVLRVSGDTLVKLQLWDVAGQERFTWMTRVYYRDAKGCIIMFDLTNRNSFLNVSKWKEDLDSKVWLSDGSKIPCLLLANKCDLKEREVEMEEIEKLYSKLNFIGWTETSAKDDMMVKDSVKFLVDTMLKNDNDDEAKVTDEAGGRRGKAYRLSSKATQNGGSLATSGVNGEDNGHPSLCLC